MTDLGDALAPGTRLDEFEIERVLGAGGFGVTYLARDLSLDTWRAVKEYLPRDWAARRGDGTIGPRTGADAEDYEWGLTRFLEEARILARFDHPHLVRVYRVFEAQGTAYMVTEYVEGETLAAGLKESGPWPEPQVRELLDALTEGLSAVHGEGLLHRDIKPGNVMVRPDGTPVLIDFGAARQAMGRQSRSVTAVLTPGYAPIEQYSPRGNQGPWTDIYALGALAYEALSGQAPDDATERVAEDPLRPLAEAAALPVSAAMEAAVDAALAVHKQDRPQSLDALRALLDGPAGVAPVSSRPRVAESSGALSPSGVGVGSEAVAAWRRWWLPGTAAAGLVAVALAVALTAPWNPGEPVVPNPVPNIPPTPPPAPDPTPPTPDPPARLPAPSPAALRAAADMVVIPAGRFLMGCVSGRDCEGDEQPVHEVTVGSFALSKYEVTFEEYDRFTEATGGARADDEGWGRSSQPVINVSWEDARAYVSWLSAETGETGETYRLPSEAEWEYAARAGTTTAYSWGNGIGDNRANCDGCGSRWDVVQTAPVGSFGANAWGLHDMHGNVWEWVEDCWYGNYTRVPSDGTAWTSGGDCGRRVLRSGSWNVVSRRLRSAKRARDPPGYRSGVAGFRVARTLTR